MGLWCTGMGGLSAGITAWGTNGNVGLTILAGGVAAALTALIGPSLVAFFGGDW